VFESINKSALYPNAPKALAAQEVLEKMDHLDWSSTVASLDERGCALLPRILSSDECRALADL
jgi:hypothetical protein